MNNAIAAAVVRGLKPEVPEAGAHLLDGVALVRVRASVSVGMPTEARSAYRPDVSALLVQFGALVGVTDPAHLAALVTSASHHARVLPTCAAAADAVGAALDRYGRAVSETLPRVHRAGAVSVRGAVDIIEWRASGSLAEACAQSEKIGACS